MTSTDQLVLVSPDERTFRAHLEGASYRIGADRGRWRLVSVDWPHAVIAVAAAARPDSPVEFFLRFDLCEYPQQVPLAAPWDPGANAALSPDRRPRGEIVGHVFRHDWHNGLGLYAPYDRSTAPGHDDWSAKHPADIWNASCDISFVLTRVWQLLNNNDYLGAAR